jgi:hypothetical protein
MKYVQKGSVVIWVIVVLVIIVLGVGGYLCLKSNSTKTEQSSLNTSFQTDANFQSQSFATTSVQNCGEVINAPHSDATQQQKNAAAYACMSRAVVICSPATMTEPLPSDTGMKTFMILSGNSDYCPISEMIDSPASKMTCNIPSGFISAMSQFLQTKNQPGMLFYTIPFFFIPPSTPASSRPIVKNPLTDQIVTAQCSLN